MHVLVRTDRSPKRTSAVRPTPSRPLHFYETKSLAAPGARLTTRKALPGSILLSQSLTVLRLHWYMSGQTCFFPL